MEYGDAHRLFLQGATSAMHALTATHTVAVACGWLQANMCGGEVCAMFTRCTHLLSLTLCAAPFAPPHPPRTELAEHSILTQDEAIARVSRAAAEVGYGETHTHTRTHSHAHTTLPCLHQLTQSSIRGARRLPPSARACLCARLCARSCASACEHAHTFECARMGVRACACVCVWGYCMLRAVRSCVSFMRARLSSRTHPPTHSPTPHSPTHSTTCRQPTPMHCHHPHSLTPLQRKTRCHPRSLSRLSVRSTRSSRSCR
jgi:hypothetical protein